jgi:cytochrome oxidase assembly protein ShyY1
VASVIWPLLRTRRWQGFTAVVVFAIVAFGLLSAWQWSRAEQHRTERIALDAALSGSPVRFDGTTAVPEWTPVTLTGSYRPDLQAAVRKRPLNAMNGFWLMTALEDERGTLVWVNRGWLPATGDALATPEFPSPPAGQVSVTGYARAFEAAQEQGNTGLPPGQVAAPAAELLPAAGEGTGGYVQLTASDPEQTGLIALPLPEIDVDEGRNISYAIQWIFFALVAMGGWYFYLRREAREDAAALVPAAQEQRG